MEVNIDEIIGNIRVVDSDSILTPNVLKKIAGLVIEVMQENEAHRQRINWEQQINSVRDQLEEERG